MEYNIEYFNALIKDSQIYYAHICPGKKAETLSEHSSLVYDYAYAIASKENLISIIGELAGKAVPAYFDHREMIVRKTMDLFWQAIAWHDMGKVNPEFQRYRMDNSNPAMPQILHSFGSRHSAISTYIYLARFFQDFLSMNSKGILNDQEGIYLCAVALYLSYPIYLHHNSDLRQAQNDIVWKNENMSELKPILDVFNFQMTKSEITSFHENLLGNADCKKLFRYYNKIAENNMVFPLFALIKLEYSLLTTADYLATAHYMNGWKNMLSDFGLIDKKLKEHIINSIETTKFYNKKTYDLIKNKKPYKFSFPDIKSKSNLNILRNDIAYEVIKNTKDNADKHLFYIEAPTGSGKTNLSILALAELLKADNKNKINKIFYVFPFTTLITQTYTTLNETLELSPQDITKVSSKSNFHIKNDDNENEFLSYLDNLFTDYPITLLSHVTFFKAMKTNEKEGNYLFHRLANSVVIIDEIQAYSPKIWDKLVYFITNFADMLNMRFIIMSATLPKIFNLQDNGNKDDFIHLISDSKKYFHNPNFAGRIKFNMEMLDLAKPDKDDKCKYLINVEKEVIEKSLEYSKHNSDNVRTVIEFVFKNTANLFYQICKNDKEIPFDEIYLLSGTILEPRRKEIIDNIKSDDLKNKKILLICTQVIEAGVDIDMDIGFKDHSLVDSDEQLAGRINRNNAKNDNTLYLFDCDEKNILYSEDERFNILKQISRGKYEEILRNKDFDLIYDIVMKEIKKSDNQKYCMNLNNYKNYLKRLDFTNIDNEFNIINSETVSVFVPLKIPYKHFKEKQKIIDEFGIDIKDGNVHGKEVWEKYKNILLNGEEGFIQRRINLKKIQSLISDFIFSICQQSRDYKILETFGEIKYGFLYLENYDQIYSFTDGINARMKNDYNLI